MKSRLFISVLAGLVTGAAVFKITHFEPALYGLLFGAINAAVVFAVCSIANLPPTSK